MEREVLFHLVGHGFGADHPADQQAGEERHDRHEYRVGDKVEKVEERHAEDLDRSQRAVPQAGGQAEQQYEQGHGDRGRPALPVQLVAHDGDDGLHQGNGRGQRREQHQQKEHAANQMAHPHAFKYLRQRSEHQAGAGVDAGWVAAVERHHRRYDHQTRDKGDRGVEDLDLADRAL